jgi:hypothetical protein
MWQHQYSKSDSAGIFESGISAYQSMKTISNKAWHGNGGIK